MSNDYQMVTLCDDALQFGFSTGGRLLSGSGSIDLTTGEFQAAPKLPGILSECVGSIEFGLASKIPCSYCGNWQQPKTKCTDCGAPIA